MAKDNNMLKWLDGKKMYIGTFLYFVAQGLKALNPTVLKPLISFEIPNEVLTILEDVGITLGVWGAGHKTIKETQK